MSTVVLIEACFWPRFSQWDILGKVRKTVIFILYGQFSFSTSLCPNLLCLWVTHTFYPRSLKSLDPCIQLPLALWFLLRFELKIRWCYGFQWYFHWTNNADDTILMAEIEEELKSLLMKVKVVSEKVGLKLNIQKTKIMATGPITSWEIDRANSGNSIRLYFGGLQNQCRCWLLPWN